MVLHTLHNFLAKFTSRQRSYVLSGPFGFVPAEILDLVISHLANDKAALMQCALVHPTWTRVSRHHLAPLTLAVSSRSHAKELTNVLNSPRETLSLSITGITLIGNAPFYDISTNDKSSRVRLYTKLLQLLKAKNIMLRSGMVVNDPSLVGIFARYFSDLTEFKVIFAFYQDIVSFMRALCDSFPRLTGLSIELGTDGMDFPDAPLPGLCDLRLSAPCLRSLRVVGWNNALVRWLGDNIVGTLEQLELQSMSLRSTCRIQESVGLIQGNKAKLSDVRMAFVKPDVAFDLSGLVCLQNLEVTSGMGGMESVLDGWRLPRSLKRVCLREGVRMFVGLRRWEPREVVFEGETLQRMLGK